MLSNIANMARVLDAQTVVVGMRPQVAITLGELGLTLPGINTALDVDRGLAPSTASLMSRKRTYVQVERSNTL